MTDHDPGTGKPSRETLDARPEAIALHVADRFESEGDVASGGMGSIEVVIDPALQRRVARKVMHPHLQSKADFVRRFVREARITGRLEHPNIVPIHEAGVDGDGRIFFCMKLVSGETFEALCDRKTSNAPEDLYDLLEVLTRVCDALSFAHSRGVLHCDVKPANVMVGDFGQVYLMDWGIARVLSSEEADRPTASDSSPDGSNRDLDPALTPSLGPARSPEDSEEPQATANDILGSPAYMAPEQAWGKRRELTPAADVFAVGALLYRLLAGRPPNEGDTFLAAVYSAQMEPPAALPEDAPNELRQIVQRALQKEPKDRYASAEELKQALVRFIRGGGDFPARRYRAGEEIVRLGEVGQAAYVILSGSCDAIRDSDGERRVLRTMVAGEAFGETAILSQGPRTATVIAREDTVLQVVDRANVERELGSMKPWMGAILRGLAERFRDLESQR